MAFFFDEKPSSKSKARKAKTKTGSTSGKKIKTVSKPSLIIDAKTGKKKQGRVGIPK